MKVYTEVTNLTKPRKNLLILISHTCGSKYSSRQMRVANLKARFTSRRKKSSENNTHVLS